MTIDSRKLIPKTEAIKFKTARLVNIYSRSNYLDNRYLKQNILFKEELFKEKEKLYDSLSKSQKDLGDDVKRGAIKLGILGGLGGAGLFSRLFKKGKAPIGGVGGAGLFSGLFKKGKAPKVKITGDVLKNTKLPKAKGVSKIKGKMPKISAGSAAKGLTTLGLSVLADYTLNLAADKLILDPIGRAVDRSNQKTWDGWVEKHGEDNVIKKLEKDLATEQAKTPLNKWVNMATLGYGSIFVGPNSTKIKKTQAALDYIKGQSGEEKKVDPQTPIVEVVNHFDNSLTLYSRSIEMMEAVNWEKLIAKNEDKKEDKGKSQEEKKVDPQTPIVEKGKDTITENNISEKPGKPIKNKRGRIIGYEKVDESIKNVTFDDFAVGGKTQSIVGDLVTLGASAAVAVKAPVIASKTMSGVNLWNNVKQTISRKKKLDNVVTNDITPFNVPIKDATGIVINQNSGGMRNLYSRNTNTISWTEIIRQVRTQ
tara:strand:+ start:2448 stop:3887 length:1440 start_codon:yes stop_codon:yes gene_type:complete